MTAIRMVEETANRIVEQRKLAIARETDSAKPRALTLQFES